MESMARRDGPASGRGTGAAKLQFAARNLRCIGPVLALGLVFALGCGDQFRPTIIPVAQNGGNPAALSNVIVLSTNPQDNLDEKLIVQAEALMAHVVNPDYRHAIVNNIGKGGGDLG